MNEDLVEYKVDACERELINHSNRIDKLEQQVAKFAIQIENLCSDLKDLTGVLKWLVGVMITSLVGFFMWAIQSGLFKYKG